MGTGPILTIFDHLLVSWSLVRWSVGSPSVGHNFLKGKEVTLFPPRKGMFWRQICNIISKVNVLRNINLNHED